MYAIINLNSLVFSNNRTLEFRISPSTFNHIKVSNWLFFCIAFCVYAERYTKEIISGKIKPTLKDILNGFSDGFGGYEFKEELGTEISNYLIAYFEYRKKMVAEATEKGDVFARNIEFEADKNFTFKNDKIEYIY